MGERRRKHETPLQRNIRREIEDTTESLRYARTTGGGTKSLEDRLRRLERELRDASRA